MSELDYYPELTEETAFLLRRVTLDHLASSQIRGDRMKSAWRLVAEIDRWIGTEPA